MHPIDFHGVIKTNWGQLRLHKIIFLAFIMCVNVSVRYPDTISVVI